MSDEWQFWIDVGGTFTDCIGVAPDGRLSQHKTLSSGITRGTIEQVIDVRHFADAARQADPDGFWDSAAIRFLDCDGSEVAATRVVRFSGDDGRFRLESDVPQSTGLRYEINPGRPAPVSGIRWLLGLSADESVPPSQIRFGTTRGTNALLTRNGARTALITTEGFADVPLIGNQDRPRLFDLNISKPEPLFKVVVEVEERVTADGTVLTPLNRDHVRSDLLKLREQGIESLAICLLHAWKRPDHELQIVELARQIGFQEISHSHNVSPQIRFVPRCDTTVLDAYLNPVLRSYLADIRIQLPGSRILMMTSAGGLVDADAFRGRDSILSGPAGGITGFSTVATNAGFQQAIGFDMGGTSTDVARYGGRFKYEQETTRAGVRIMTPMLAIETVAAGGGSICGFDGVRLHVGPESAGAEPGPACYGARGPLTVTDLNVFLGRVIADYFPFELDRQAVERRLEELSVGMQRAGAWRGTMTLVSLAEGLLQIANDNMVQAIRRVSVAEGYDPAEHVLVGFGGAGGQHVCSVARSLGTNSVLLHPFAGILSAWGMGQADIKCQRSRSILQPLVEASLTDLQCAIEELTDETRQYVLRQGVDLSQLQDPYVEFDIRYQGTESTLAVAAGSVEECRIAFEREFRRQFGYIRGERELEVSAVRVETVAQAATGLRREAVAAASQPAVAETKRQVVFGGIEWQTPVYLRESLAPGTKFDGPAIVCEDTSTIVVEPDCRVEVMANGSILLTVGNGGERSRDSHADAAIADPILLELFNNQFVSIARQMGETLRRTSVSTNVRERLDYSCALFDRDGLLVVNAPHVPVHLGAMGETVRAIMQDHSGMQSGDVFVTNNPYRGGSHLPDVTVVTPVFTNSDAPSFFVANRAHHAEIGGIVPGSMPPFSKNLAEEGVLIQSCHLVRAGESQEELLRQLLSSGPSGSRNVDDNLADLAAQAAANTSGASLLQNLCRQHSVSQVQTYMRHIQQAAERKMRLSLSSLEDRSYEFSDRLDDGSEIRVSITVQGDSATVDFRGTADVHPGNLNANRAITTAAVLYAFRCLLNEDVPLNAGVLAPLDLVIPSGLLNPPEGRTPWESPAMVGGNVETSQRIVDVLLGALQLAAASQGTMNNLTFGDEAFGYYETICGGSGATTSGDGADAVHTHMTNTRLTDPEILEQRYPVRLKQFAIRSNSGGAGKCRGGNGIIREIEFLQDLQVSMLSERRQIPPWGLNGGQDGTAGRNTLSNGDEQSPVDVGGAFSRRVAAGDVLRIETPGGGGVGEVES